MLPRFVPEKIGHGIEAHRSLVVVIPDPRDIRAGKIAYHDRTQDDPDADGPPAGEGATQNANQNASRQGEINDEPSDFANTKARYLRGGGIFKPIVQ